MKQLSLLLLITITILTFNSCDNESTEISSAANKFSVDVDGVTFTAIGQSTLSFTSIAGKFISIAGIEKIEEEAPGETCVIIFSIPENTLLNNQLYVQEEPCISNTTNEICIAASYGFKNSATDELDFTTNHDSNDNINVDFSIAGNEIGDRIKGTFHGKLQNDAGEFVTLTNGEFDLIIQ